MKEQAGKQRGNYAPNNVAKLWSEYSSEIERAGLIGRYGEGFGGAPLRIPSSRPSVPSTDLEETHHGTAQEIVNRTSGGHRDV